MQFMNMFKSRKFRQGTAATVITILVIALIVVLNLLVTAVSDRYSLSVDLTENKVFTLSPETVDFLATLDRDVKIWFLFEENAISSTTGYYKQTYELVKKYVAQSPHITLEFQNIVENPTFASNYPDLTLSMGDILLESGEKTVRLSSADLFNSSMSFAAMGGSIASSKAEQSITSGILSLVTDQKIVVSFLGEHGEVDASAFANNLTLNNYECIQQNLLTEDIHPEAAVAVLAAPTRDLSEEETKKLDRFLENGGNYGKTLVYFATPGQPDMPVMNAFLEEWGVRPGDGLVIDIDTRNTYGDMSMPITNYVGSTYGATLAQKSLYAIAPLARPMEILFTENGSRTVRTLLQFSATSTIIPSDAQSGWAPTQDDIKPNLPALILAQQAKETAEGEEPLVSSVLISSTVSMIDPAILSNLSFSNNEYMLELFDDLAGREVTIRIQDKTMGGNEISITTATIIQIAIVIVVIFPLAVLIFGIVVWLRRRHR